MSRPLINIEAIEDSINDAVRGIVLSEPNDKEPGQAVAKYEAQEYLRLFQENQLKDLRDAFE